MSERRLFIECGAAETRAALLVGDEIIRFWFGPARGDEALARAPQPGDLFIGRVRSVSKPLSGAFVDLGEGTEGFLPFGKNAAPQEGAAVAVMVRRPAMGAKGPLLFAKHDLKAPASLSAPARIGPLLDSALQAARALGGADEILIDRADAAQILRAASEIVPVTIKDAPFEAFDVEPIIDAALARAVWLDAGARLTIDESEAITAVDVDSGSAADGATGKLNDKVNVAAASQLFHELSRRGIGGRIIVDFLPPSGAEVRQKFMEQLRMAKHGIYDCRLGRLSADGLFDLTAPRERISLLQQATEPAGAGWPQPGRRLTLDWEAKAAIRALERQLRAQPTARLALFAGEGLGSYLSRNPKWQDRLGARFGARFEVTASGALEERAFEVAEKR